MLWLSCTVSFAADPNFAATARAGKPIADIVDDFRALGYPFAYSTSLLTREVVVVETPTGSNPVEIIRELLEPYEITIDLIEGVYVIHKSSVPASSRNESISRIVDATPPIPELTVSASRYEILRNIVVPGAFIGQQQIQQMPILGDDPVRAAQILPGIAANSVSAKSYVRGSDSRDTGIVLNGNALLEPYHVRNFQSLFSAIDSRAVDGIEVFSGNFPVRYGNQIGGLLVIDTMEPMEQGRTELGLSVFNTSFLSTGKVADSQIGWLVSARRGNLDLVIDEEYGEPSYNDFLGQISVDLTDNATISVNALVATDRINLITESKPSEPEASSNAGRTAQFWINWRQRWSPAISSLTTASINDFDNDRIEFANDPEEIIANVNDSRSLKILRLNQHWVIHPQNSIHQLTFGLEMESLDASYDFVGTAQYFGVFRMVEGVPISVVRESSLTLSGQSFAGYLSDEFSIGKSTIARLGLRWDSQNYGNLDKTSQLGPRISVAHAVNSRTNIRASVGRYYQAQGMHELQVEDGEENFFRAERTDSATVGIQHRYLNGLSLRTEAYWKSGDRLRPRFENILNPLTVLPEFKPDRSLIAPVGFRSRGVEFSLQREHQNGLTWWATYVYSTADDEFDSAYVPRSWDQKHAMRLGLSVKGEKWDFGLVATGHSGWPKTSVTLDTSDPSSPIISFTERNRMRYSYFATLDMRVRYTAPVRVGKLTYFFELSNATNRENQCCVDFDVNSNIPNPPLLELEEKYWLPLTPAVGVLWQF